MPMARVPTWLLMLNLHEVLQHMLILTRGHHLSEGPLHYLIECRVNVHALVYRINILALRVH